MEPKEMFKLLNDNINASIAQGIREKEAQHYSNSSKDELVKVHLNGNYNIKEIEIDDSLYSNTALLKEDLMEAINGAIKIINDKASEDASKAYSKYVK